MFYDDKHNTTFYSILYSHEVSHLELQMIKIKLFLEADIVKQVVKKGSNPIVVLKKKNTEIENRLLRYTRIIK